LSGIPGAGFSTAARISRNALLHPVRFQKISNSDMDKYIDKFMRYLEIEKNYSQHTILNYKLDLSDFDKFCGGLDLEKIDYLLLRKYLAVLKEKSLGNRSVGRHLSSLRSFFRYLTREGLIK